MFILISLSMVFPFLFVFILLSLPRYTKYNNSGYRFASKNSFIKTVMDRGNYGEFLTFVYLEKLDFYKKLMTNLYIPKGDGTTTEIDLIMISETGIYVFESKNYSGWIFGDERYKNWTQSLKNKQKNQFYNPIWQNKGHISALDAVLNLKEDNLYKSLIVFSERCELKKINITSPDVKVIKRNFLIKTINENINDSSTLLTKDQIDQLYLKLQEFAYADEITKEIHIKSIKKRKSVDNR